MAIFENLDKALFSELTDDEKQMRETNKLYDYSRYKNVITTKPFKVKTIDKPDNRIILKSSLYGYNSYNLTKTIFCPLNDKFIIQTTAPILEDKTYGYVHASPYEYDNIVYYASQCPRKEDMILFLTMLIQSKINIVCITTNLEQYNSGKYKITNYKWYPTVKGSRISYDGIVITNNDVIDIKVSENESITIFKLSLIINKDDEYYVQSLIVFQYNNWLDTLSPRDFSNYIKYIDVIKEYMDLFSKVLNDDEKLNILIHCSAGIGRTGVLLLSLIMLNKIDQIKSKKEIDETVFNIINTIRKSRYIIPDKNQYDFVIKYVYYLFDNK